MIVIFCKEKTIYNGIKSVFPYTPTLTPILLLHAANQEDIPSHHTLTACSIIGTNHWKLKGPTFAFIRDYDF